MNRYVIHIPNILDAFVVKRTVSLIKDITMDKNKCERDANGRFVKKTEPKKQENKKSCKSTAFSREEELKLRLFDEHTKRTSAEFELRRRDIKEAEMQEHFLAALSNQKFITTEIILELNWFQRRRLRKILSQYPDRIYGYTLEKDV